ncbi:unnamed protein product [marine sediment metagenome]|uniref:Uncharacterized protein n=1 Tax=marine sediment metagenome TaxID=412755 RepID=X1LTU0_9ZZZZ
MSNIKRKFKRMHKVNSNKLVSKSMPQDEVDDFKPIPELSVPTEYKTEYTKEWNKETGEFEEVEHLYVKLLTDPDKPKYWEEIDPSQVIYKPFPASLKED